MPSEVTVFKETKLPLKLKDVAVKVVHHRYDDITLNTTLVSFPTKRKILSTIDGLKQVQHVANVYLPQALSERVMTIKRYNHFIRHLPVTLGLPRGNVAFLSTGVDMENVAYCEKSYEDFHVCCIATGGALNNALRTGVDQGCWVETSSGFQFRQGTINIILLTNVSLSWGAMARAIVTATEAKTAALQDLNYRSTSSPKVQATGTGTDSTIVVSAATPDIVIKHTGGHTKMGELIGFTTKSAVEEALQNYDKKRDNHCFG